MKIGGYSHLNGVTFFCDIFKIRGRKRGKDINYDIEWIEPPKWLKKLEGRFILGGLLTAYYQWKVLGKQMKGLFLGLVAIYAADILLDLSFLDKYFHYYGDKFIPVTAIIVLATLMINHKKIIQMLRYHGAEHKVINCFIDKGYVDLYSVKEASRFNKRCGSNVASIFVLLYMPFLLLSIDSITITFVVFLIAIQITRILVEKNYSWDKYIQILQWITVLEPTEEQMKVAVATFNQLQRAYYITHIN